MRIGFDFDDVLVNFRLGLHSYHNKYYGTKFERDHFYHDLAKMWNCSEEESVKRVFDFYASKEHGEMLPVTGAVEGINNLKQNNDLFIITSRAEELREGTLKLVNNYFPQMFNEIYFTNQYHGGGLKRTKGQICTELGVQFFVDDMLHHAQDVASHDIAVFLLDGPWNQADIEPPIRRVHSWDEIVQILSEQDQHKYQASTFLNSQEHKNVL